MRKNKSKKKGFTLVELLIAIGIFMGFMVVVTDAFLEIVRAQKSANETRLMYSELRNFTDYLDNELREGGIDYFCYNQGFLQNLDFSQAALVRCDDAATLTVDAGNNLRTISRDGLSSSIIKFDTEKQTVCLKRYRNVDGSWQPETGVGENLTTGGSGDCGTGYEEFAFANLRVKNMKFQIYPAKDPHGAGAQDNLATQLAPMVIVDMDIASRLDTVNFDLNYHTMLTARN